MIFSHDTELSLLATAALVNTEERGADGLADLAGLERFVEEWAWTGSRRGDLAELEEVRALRPRLRRLWHLDEDGVAAQVNAILRATHVLPQLVRHNGEPYHLHATDPGDALADRMAVEAAMAFADVVRQQQLARLGICGAPDCEAVLVDLSRNRLRVYCSATCSSRVNVAAFRARRR